MQPKLIPFVGHKHVFESAKDLDAPTKRVPSDPPRGDRRRCGNCGERFQPTVKFRLLCLNCRKRRDYF